MQRARNLDGLRPGPWYGPAVSRDLTAKWCGGFEVVMP